ncbi:hypothetical protein Tco_0070651 [Tanacetum coccineum]
MHERPAGKVGMYTRFFDYANYRIPFSNFFVSILIHFRIPFSQLSVFGSAKVSHFEIMCCVCNIEPIVGLFRYFYTHNYKNGWFGFTKRPNVRACYSKNLDSVKNWNDHFFWVDEFVVPANDRFNWFSGSNISKDRAPVAFEYNVEHASILITHASPFLSMRAERVEMDLNAFIRTTDPHKVRIVERARADNEEPIVTVAKHRTVTPLLTSVVRPFGDLSESVEREFGGDVSGSAGRGHEDASVSGYSDAEPIVPVTAGVAAETRLRADYGNTSGSVIGGKFPSVLNRFLQASQLTVEQGVAALPTLPFITSSVTASPLKEGGGHTDSATASALRTVGPSERFVVLSDSSHYSSAKSADAEVDSLIRSAAPVMTAATTVTTSVSAAATTDVALTDVNKDKNVPTPSIFVVSSSYEKTNRTLNLFTVTKGFELNDGRSCANMIDHFTPPAFFKTVHGMEHEQLFAEFNVSAACNLSLSSEVRMCAEYNILEKRKWRSLTEERNDLLQVKDKEIKGLKSQLLQARDESMKVAQLRTWVASLEDIESSLQGEDSFHPHLLNVIAGRRWLLAHGMRLLMAKCLNSSEYMEALRNAFGRAIEKGMQEEDDFNSAVQALRDFLLLQELTTKRDASTLDVMDLFPLDDVVAEVLGMTGLQPDVSQLMVPVCHKQDQVVVGSQTLSVALDICHRRVRKMERNLTELIRPTPDSFLLVEDYENPHLAYAVPGGVIPEPRGEGKVEGSNDADVGDLVLSQLEGEARDAVL